MQFFNFLSHHFSETKTVLVWLIEKQKHQVDKNGFAGAISMNRSKTFDMINNDLIITKLHAYGFQQNRFFFLILIHDLSEVKGEDTDSVVMETVKEKMG